MSATYLTCIDCGERHKANTKHFPQIVHGKRYDKEKGETTKYLAGYRCKKCCLRKDRKGLNQTRKEQKISFIEKLREQAKKLNKKG